ncbi:heat shock protein HspQ [Coraliomargarita sp. SDUM461003]|uniref:Heat shock protein HspQ n=1 Tax=Thalassobacterium maritimum TaxID=3041265 RepID=A0ABU1B0Q8_9BACT|nr:heat shock protein HspQ [Coraliomargarita sp. SDUM461003]MDQ8209030.1 heat shock protein HspQ [Coraliomargarita sp. SDUM461003]
MLIGLTDIDGGAAPGIYFELGVVVIHQLYGYRGVIVAVDPRCMAGETWYQCNKTQPPREQPWYHVLVHDSGGLSTYVAQSNLSEDTSGQPINHPRIDSYFVDFKEGRYQLKKKSSSKSGL